MNGHENNLVTIESIVFGYSNRPILNGVSLKIPRGKVIAVMGGSGTGKTTLLKIIGRQILPSDGRVFIDGKNLLHMTESEVEAKRRKMGMLFQFGALFTDLSVFDNVAFPLREKTNLPEPIIRNVVLLKLEAVGLRGAVDFMPSELSGGMARRVSLARAVALDPELILYDEPFSGLDPISLGVTSRLIRRLNDALGASSVVVTHDVASSVQFADYIYFLSQGKVVAEGTPAEIKRSTDAFVRQFIDGAPDGPIPFHYPAAPLCSMLTGQ